MSLAHDVKTSKAHYFRAAASASSSAKHAAAAIKKVMLGQHDGEHDKVVETAKKGGAFLVIMGILTVIGIVVNIVGSFRLHRGYFKEFTKKSCKHHKWGTFANTMGWLGVPIPGVGSFTWLASIYPIVQSFKEAPTS